MIGFKIDHSAEIHLSSELEMLQHVQVESSRFEMNCLKSLYHVLLLAFLQRSVSESITKTICQSDKANHILKCSLQQYIKIQEIFYGSRGNQSNYGSSLKNSWENKSVFAAINEKCNCTIVTEQPKCVINMEQLETKSDNNNTCLKPLQIIYDCVDHMECGLGVTTASAVLTDVVGSSTTGAIIKQFPSNTSNDKTTPVSDISTTFKENGIITRSNLSEINSTSSTTTVYSNRAASNSWVVVVVVVLLILVILALIGLYWIACRKKQCIQRSSSKTKATRSMTYSFANGMQETANEGLQNIQSQTVTYETIAKNERFVVENQLYASQTAVIQKNYTENTGYDIINSSRNHLKNENEGTSKSQYSKLNADAKKNKTDANYKQMEYNELYEFEETGGEHIDPSSIYNEILEPSDQENAVGSHYQTVHNELYDLN